MRFIHLADLHLGKSIYGTSLVENGDQPVWADRLTALCRELKPDALVIAGDIYDRSAPSAEAMSLLSRMLTELSGLGIPVLLTAGNHDSTQRLAFLRELLAQHQLCFSAPLTGSGQLAHITLRDSWGPVTFWLMPYVFPALVGEVLGREFHTYDEAVRGLLEIQDINPEERNVLVAHQNVTAGGLEAPRGGSESMVGGVGQVDYTAFDAFDYVALGHIHAGCWVGRPEVRYAGSPLCYHFDEVHQPPKGPLLVELGEKGAPVQVQVLQLPPLHPMRDLQGPYEALRDQELAAVGTGEYLRIVLTDRRVTPEISEFFHELYRSRNSILMELDSAFRLHAPEGGGLTVRQVREKSLPELFGEFCAAQRGGAELSEDEQALVHQAAEQMEGEDLRKDPTEKVITALVELALREEAPE